MGVEFQAGPEHSDAEVRRLPRGVHWRQAQERWFGWLRGMGQSFLNEELSQSGGQLIPGNADMPPSYTHTHTHTHTQRPPPTTCLVRSHKEPLPQKLLGKQQW